MAVGLVQELNIALINKNVGIFTANQSAIETTESPIPVLRA